MEEPGLKASIDPFPAPEESKGLNMVRGFLGIHKGADARVCVIVTETVTRVACKVVFFMCL